MRDLKAEEKRLWRYAVGSVRPLKRRLPSSRDAQHPPANVRHQQASSINDVFGLPLPFSMKKYKERKVRQAYERDLGIDGYNTSRRGSEPFYKDAQATLDLHGYTLNEAFNSFLDFVQKAVNLRIRCVHIITGLGPLPDGGVLRHELPLWIEHPKISRFVLSKGYVQKNNPGAMYLVLRAGR